MNIISKYRGEEEMKAIVMKTNRGKESRIMAAKE